MNNKKNESFYKYKSSLEKQREIRERVSSLTLKEKTKLLLSEDFSKVDGCARVGIEPIIFKKSGLGQNVTNQIFSDGGDMQKPTAFLSCSTISSSFDRNLAFDIGRGVASQLVRQNVDVVIVPSAGIKRNILNGNDFECYSEDPFLSGNICAGLVNGIESLGICAAIKDFLSCSRIKRRFTTNCIIDKKALNEIYLEAQRIAILNSNPSCIILSGNKINGEYVAQSKKYIEVLRKKFGFRGLIASANCGVENRAESILAGVDLDMSGESTKTDSETEHSVKKRTVGENVVSDAAFEVAMLSDYVKASRTIAEDYDILKNQLLSQKSVEQTAVLLKNESEFLPFSKNENIAIIGSFAHKKNNEKMSMVDVFLEQKVMFDFAKGYNLDGTTNDNLINEAKNLAKNAHKTLVVVGAFDPFEVNVKKDRDDISLSQGMLKLINSLGTVTKNIAVILTSHQPVQLPFLDKVKSVLAVDISACKGETAAFNLIFGNCCPSGKLAESWPEKLSQIPTTMFTEKDKNTQEYREGIYVGYRYFQSVGLKPMFPFGFGLSYSEFEHSDMRLDRTSVAELETLTISFCVKNVGRYVAADVVQIYVSKKNDKYKELKNFEKIFLLPNEKRTVELTLSRTSFSRYNPNTQAWQEQPGEYTVHLACDAQNILMSCDVLVLGKNVDTMPKYFAADEIKTFGEKTFYIFAEYSKNQSEYRKFSVNSTVSELSRCSAGIAFKKLMEDSEISKHSDFENLPLRCVVALSRGEVSKKSINTLVDFCNKNIKGTIKNLILPQ